MPVKGNQFRSNSFREEPESQPRTKPRERIQKEKTEYLPKFDLSDGRIVKIAGLFFLIVSLYFLVAFTSYLFTWQEDQSYVLDANGGWHNLFKTPAEFEKAGQKVPVVE